MNALGVNLMAAIANCGLIDPHTRTRAGFLQLEFDRLMRAELSGRGWNVEPNPNSPWANGGVNG